MSPSRWNREVNSQRRSAESAGQTMLRIAPIQPSSLVVATLLRMNVNEILTAISHQKVIFLSTVAVFVGIGIGVLQLVPKEYEATSTLALSPRTPDLNSLVFFQTIDSIIPIYATAAQTDETKNLARASLHGRLADISVRTFTDAPILKIVARGKNKALVRAAQNVSTALQSRVAEGKVGVPSLRLEQIDRPVYPKSPVFPRTNLTLAVAGIRARVRHRSSPLARVVREAGAHAGSSCRCHRSSRLRRSTVRERPRASRLSTSVSARIPGYTE